MLSRLVYWYLTRRYLRYLKEGENLPLNEWKRHRLKGSTGMSYVGFMLDVPRSQRINMVSGKPGKYGPIKAWGPFPSINIKD